MMLKLRFLAILFIVLELPLAAQSDLREMIASEIAGADARVGVAFKHIERGDTLSHNGNQKFPMQSVYKLHLGLAVLNQVEQGKLSLNQKIRISKSDLLENSWSPIAKKYPDGNVELTVRELLKYSISQSDNSACDILFRLVGGPAGVEQFMRRSGIENVSIVYTEAEMHKSWDAQYSNWTTPTAMVELLDRVQRQRVLRAEATAFVLNVMAETITGAKRIKGQLPPETIVAHKTGMSGLSEEGIRGAVNDVGIITLPDGTHVAIAFFITDTKVEVEPLESLMAKISKHVFDHFAAEK